MDIEKYRQATERFWQKTCRLPNGCIEWTASKFVGGYGAFGFNGKTVCAHRWAYERWAGEIPVGMQLDHLCRNRACVNPAHLEPVSLVENVMRGDTITAGNLLKTHCPQGHSYDDENTRIVNGSRTCRICGRAASQRWKAKVAYCWGYRNSR